MASTPADTDKTLEPEDMSDAHDGAPFLRWTGDIPIWASVTLEHVWYNPKGLLIINTTASKVATKGDLGEQWVFDAHRKDSPHLDGDEVDVRVEDGSAAGIPPLGFADGYDKAVYELLDALEGVKVVNDV